jgi:hypothetical protein
MAATLADWQAIETAIINNLKNGVHVASFSAGGQSWSFQTLESQQKFLTFVRTQIAGHPSNTEQTMFAKVRFTSL